MAKKKPAPRTSPPLAPPETGSDDSHAPFNDPEEIFQHLKNIGYVLSMYKPEDESSDAVSGIGFLVERLAEVGEDNLIRWAEERWA